MAELFGRVDGCSRGRGGSMHLFDLRAALPRRLRDRRRQPAALRRRGARRRLHRDRRRDPLDDGRRRHQPGHVRRDHEPRRALEAAGRVPDHQQPVRDGHRPPPPLGRDRPVAASPRASACRARAATAWTCWTCTRWSTEALRCAREERKPQLVEAVTYRFRGHSMADPEEYRTKEEVEEWRGRDPIAAFAKRLVDEGVIDEEGRRGDRREGDRGRGRGGEVRRRVALPRPRLALRRRLRLLGDGARLVDRGRALARGAPRRARARGRRGCRTSWPSRARPTRARATREARRRRGTEDAARASPPRTSPRQRAAPTECP